MGLTDIFKKKASYEHEHEWLPEGKYWGPNSADNDQRLFQDGGLRPEVRADLLGKWSAFCQYFNYMGWSQWSKVYFAGSQAAKWLDAEGHGNNDFDVLVGVDYIRFRGWNPVFQMLSDQEISEKMTDQMRHHLNDSNYTPPGSSDHYDQTWYQNISSYDIRAIRPYAAYNVSDDVWAVKPLEVPSDWSAESLPESFWDVSEAEANLINVIAELPPVERQRVAEQVYDMIHEGRKAAFNKGGKSMFDFNNVVEKYLDQRPDHPLAKLIAMKKETPDPNQDAWMPPQPDFGDYKFASLRQAVAESQKGIMIAFVPPLEIRQELVQEKGEPVEDMHVTVAYMGQLDEMTPKQRRHLPDLVRNWAVAQHPLRATISGVGTFANPNNHALIALPDIPHAGKMRESLVDYLEAHGYGIYHNHGWTPHLTLGYSKYHWRFIPKTQHVSWPIEGISVFLAGNETYIPFGPRSA